MSRLALLLALLLLPAAAQAQSVFPNMLGSCVFVQNCSLGGSGGHSGSSPTNPILLLENGTALLLETGAKILLEGLPGFLQAENAGFVLLETGGRICLQGNVSC